MKKPEKFDGNLVFVANNREIQDGHYYFYNEHLGTFLPISGDLLHTLGGWHYLKGKAGVSEILRKRSDWEIAKARKESKKLAHPEIYEILEKGRLQINLLLNSPGGRGLFFDSIRSAINYIIQQKGRVAAFGGPEISSAAADLFMLAPKNQRFLGPHAELMFHLSNIASDDPIRQANEVLSMDEFDIQKFGYANKDEAFQDALEYYNKVAIPAEKERQEAEIKDLLLINTSKRKREKMKSILDQAFNNPVKPDCPIYFNAIQAEELGLAKLVDFLSHEFQQINGIKSDSYKNTAIASFFDQADMEFAKNLLQGLLKDLTKVHKGFIKR